MDSDRRTRLAITEVITETIGGAVHVALSSKQLNARQRKQLSRPAKRVKYLTTPCKVDVSLKISEFAEPQRSEAWIYVNGRQPVLKCKRGLKPVKVELGEPVELDCEIEAEPAPTKIRWYRNGQELDGPRYVKANDSSMVALKIPRSTVEDVGDYVVSVSNDVAEIQSTAPVIVLFERPTFVRPLCDTDVDLGEKAELTCSVRGLPVPKVTWSASESALRPSDKYQIGIHGDDLVLVIDKVSVDDLKKVYVCHAINEVGEDRTSAKLVPIVPPQPPEFIETFHDKSIEEGQPLLLNAKVVGFPKPTIRWIRNEYDILKAAAVDRLTTTEVDGGKVGISVQGIRRDMGGTYKCIAENEAGIAACIARITVTERMLPPDFIVNLTNQEVTEDEQAEFDCTARGKPLPEIVWYINGVEVKDDDKRVRTTSTTKNDDVTAKLTFSDLTLNDTGQFKAVAKNPAGVASTEANLLVIMRTLEPILLQGPTDLEITEDENAFFEATLDGKPQPTVEWLKDGKLIRPSDRLIYSNVGSTHRLTIKKAVLDDEGLYVVKATNVAGDLTANANLVVNEKLWPPVFTKTLTDVVLIEEDEVCFRCTVNAKPLPTVLTWSRDGRELTNNTRLKIESTKGDENELKLSLTVAKSEMTDSGEIKVFAQNAEGEANTSARLTVNMRTVKPTLLKGPEDQQITEEEDASFSATISAKPQPKVQWFKGENLVQPSDRLVYADDGSTYTLTIQKAALTDKGPYTIRAVNVAGQIEATANLLVREKLWPPTFTEKMIDATSIEEDNVSFTCTVNAKPIPQITWFKDGKEIKENLRIKPDSTRGKENELKLSLTISIAEMTDSGEIKVVAKNSEGEANDMKTLKINMRTRRPALLKGPSDLEITEDDDAYFEATIDAKPSPSVQWFKTAAHKLIQPTDRMIYSNNGLTYKLTIKNATLDDKGLYTVKATNVAGDVAGSAMLAVKDRLWPPVFTDKMVNETKLEEDNVTFRCTVNAKPVPTITWFRDGRELKESPRIKHEISKGNDNELKLSLSVREAEMTDSGEIKVLARNSEGEASNLAVLTVNMRARKPQFLKGPSDLEITEEEDGYFEATIDAKPSPQVQWLKDNKLIEPTDRTIYSDDGSTYSLTINSAVLDDQGSYSVKATNMAGEMVATANLTVKEKLWPPVFTEKLNDEALTEEDDVYFSCTVNAKPLPTIITWLKNGRELMDDSRFKIESTKGNNENELKLSLTVAKSKMTDSGEIKVFARNEEGEAKTSARLTVNMRTRKPTLLKGPSDLEITEDDDGYFEATIDSKPSPRIQWLKDNQPIRDTDRMIYSDNGSTYTLTIKKATLMDKGLYSIKAVNVAGELIGSAKLVVKEKLWPPTFTEKMIDVTSIEEDEVSFKCTVNAKPIPQITWLKDGKELKESLRITYDSDKGKDNELKLTLTVSKVEMMDSGEIKAVAKNSEGEASHSAKIAINMRTIKPRFLKGPSDLEIIEDDDGSFEATVQAKPPPTIYWLKDNKPIQPSDRMIYSDDGSTYTLAISSATLDDKGLYSVKASNIAGEMTASANLVVKMRTRKPTFLKGPSDLEIIEDHDGYFEATIDAKPPPKVQWLKDNKLIQPTNRFIFSDNGSIYTLTIKNATLNDKGLYNVKATNIDGEETGSATLSVKEKLWPPMFTERLVTETLIEEDGVSLKCTVNAKPAPDITWFKDGQELKESPRLKLYTAKGDDNELKLTLTIDQAEMTDTGEIKVLAKNSEGEASNSAKFTVNMRTRKPTFLNGPSDLEITEEDDGYFEAKIDAKPLPTVEWLKDNKPIKPTEHMITSDDGLTYKLTVKKAALDDEGLYTIKVKNVAGELIGSGKLTVKEKLWPPYFTDNLTDATLLEDDGVAFRCTVNAKPTPKITWFNDGQELKDSSRITAVSLKGKENELKLTLMVNKAEMTDSGDIKVVATNSEGEASNSAKLTVNMRTRKPTFLKGPSDLEITEENDGYFEATVDAKPPPSVQWLKDNRPIQPTDRLISSDNGSAYMLTIKKAILDDKGLYSVKATNIAGEQIGSANLVVKEKLWPPMFTERLVNETLIEEDGISLKCTVNAKPAPDITWFKDGQELKESQQLKLYTAKGDDNELKLTLTIDQAEMTDTGEIKVLAKNSEGEASNSSKLTVNMRTRKPTFLKGPSDLEITEEEDGYFEATIDAKPLPAVEWLKDNKPIKPTERMITSDDGSTYKLTVKKATLDDKGLYTIKVKNVAGELIGSGKLTVKEKLWPPYFTDNLTGATLLEDDGVAFRCTVNAKPTPKITWFKDGQELKDSSRITTVSLKGKENESKLTLMVNKAEMTDSGEIKVVATNSEGEASNSAKLTVNMRTRKPALLKGPSDLEITEENDGYFEATVDAKPPPTVQWLKDNRPIQPTDRLISSDNGSTYTLTIERAILDDKGLYSIKATNVAGEQIGSAKLTVKEKLWPPYFTDNLTGATLLEDDGVAFRCTVNAKPTPKITWFKDGQELKDSSRITSVNLKGKENELKLTLMVNKAEMTDSGEIKVVATNSEGEASNSAKLTVNMRTRKPAFLKGPSDLEIIEENDGYFEATLDAKPPPTVQWLKDNRPIQPTDRLISSDNGSTYSLTIKKAILDDKGLYSIKATNVAGEQIGSANLVVKEKLWPPVFIERMADAELTEEDNVSLRCTVNAKPAPKITWFKDGKELKESPRIKPDGIRGSENEMKLMLTLIMAEMFDAGEIKVVATNSEGEATHSAKLRVNMRTRRPTLLKRPSDLEITEDDDGYFEATVDAKPPPAIQWLKDDKSIQPSDHMIYSDSGLTYKLTIKKATLSDKGSYSIKATNVAGELTGSANLSVKEKLWAPIFTEKMVDETLTEEDGVTLRCTVNAKPAPTIKWFKEGLELKESSRMTPSMTKGRDNELKLSLVISRAEMTDAGEFKVVARNSEGEESNLAKLLINMRTRKPALLKGPSDLDIIEDDDGYFEATIDARPLPTVNWLKDNKPIQPTDRLILSDNGSTYSLTIKKATLGDKGLYCIKAMNVAGELIRNAQLGVKEKLWAPVFTEVLKDEVVVEETEVSFKCTVNAKPLPTIVEWSREGRELTNSPRLKIESTKGKENELKLSLTVAKSEMTDSGRIKVFAKNAEGEANTFATLTVNMRTIRPTWVKGPSDVEITEDEDGYFQATVAGKPPPQVQWFRGEKLLKVSERVVLADDGSTYSLKIKNAYLDDAGVYTVTAKNMDGELLTTARLIVNEKLWAPEFTEKMTDQSLIEVNDVFFRCKVSGKPRPTLTWLKDGREIKDDGQRVRMDCLERNQTEQDVSLKISNLAMTDSGQFKVVAKNSVGEASNSAKLDVVMRTEKPNLIRGPADLEITEENDAYFDATVDGKPLPTVHWFKDGRLIQPSDRFVLTSDNLLRHSLTIKRGTLSDKGLYSIKAVNVVGDLTAAANLIVNERLWPPTFTEKMANTTVTENDEVRFHCVVNARPLPTIITWLRDKREIENDGRRMKIECEKGKEDELKLSLTIGKSELTDAGEFRVFAKNAQGEAVTSATLNVNERLFKPTLLNGPQDQTITEGDDGLFVATFDGKPAPSIQWFKDDVLIRPSESVIYSNVGQRHSLTIKNSTLADRGQYSIKAINVAGQLTGDAKLIVNEKLWAPRFMKILADVDRIEGDDVSFDCTVNAKPLSTITWMKDGKELASSARMRHESVRGKDDEVRLSLDVSRVEMNDAGRFKVIAKNSVGEDSTAARLNVKIRQVKPMLIKGPVGLEVTEKEKGFFQATIDGIPAPTVTWLRNDVLLRPSSRISYNVEGNDYTLTIPATKLSDAGLYTVKAVNEAGELVATARLIVNEDAPYFADMLSDVSVAEGMSADFTCKVHPDNEPVKWYNDEGVEIKKDNERYRITSKGNERHLQIIRTNRFDNGKISVALGELRSFATLTVEASETEFVETRLLWELEEDRYMKATAEFLCSRGRRTAEVMQVASMTDPGVVVIEPIQNAAQRRWIVEKAYICREGDYRVDRWSIKSYVDYTCSAEALEDIKKGILDGVKFSVQTVEFLILLRAPTKESKWLKGGRPVIPGRKYKTAIEEDGLLHTLTIHDVEEADQGIYTIMVLKETTTARIHIEGGGTMPSLVRQPSRLDFDTDTLISQLPSNVRRARSNTQIAVEYVDDRRRGTLERSSSRELLHSQLQDFDDKIAGFDDNELSRGGGDDEEEEEVFGDGLTAEASEASAGGGNQRGSLHRSGTIVPHQNPLSRASSMPSLSSRSGLKRGQSEILYFSYIESTKEASDL